MSLVIRSKSERGYWSNIIGWVYDVYSATKFRNKDGNLPMSRDDDAEFVSVLKARYAATQDRR